MKSLDIVRKDESDDGVPLMLLQNDGSTNTILERPYTTQARNDNAILSNLFKRINMACSSVFGSPTGRRVEYTKQKTVRRITTRASVMIANSSRWLFLGDLAGQTAKYNSSTKGKVVVVHMSFQRLDADWKVIVREMSSVRQSLLNTRSKTINMRLYLIHIV